MIRTVVANHTSLIAVIPQAVAEYFGLLPGDKIDFRIDNGFIKATPIHRSAKIDGLATAPTTIEGEV